MQQNTQNPVDPEQEFDKHGGAFIDPSSNWSLLPKAHITHPSSEHCWHVFYFLLTIPTGQELKLIYIFQALPLAWLLDKFNIMTAQHCIEGSTRFMSEQMQGYYYPKLMPSTLTSQLNVCVCLCVCVCVCVCCVHVCTAGSASYLCRGKMLQTTDIQTVNLK
mgnify:FL=1